MLLGNGTDLPDLPPINRIGQADRLIAYLRPDTRFGGDKAYYSPRHDFIHMPDERLFTASDSVKRSGDYYAVLFHELTHPRGAKPHLIANSESALAIRTTQWRNSFARMTSPPADRPMLIAISAHAAVRYLRAQIQFSDACRCH